MKGIAVAVQGQRNQALLDIDQRQDGRGNPYFWIAFARGKITPAERARISCACEWQDLCDAICGSISPICRNSRVWRRRWSKMIVRGEARGAFAPRNGGDSAARANLGEASDTALARFLLDLRSKGLTEPAIFNAFERVPRAPFLPNIRPGLLYAPINLPIPCGEEAEDPFTLARLWCSRVSHRASACWKSEQARLQRRIDGRCRSRGGDAGALRNLGWRHAGLQPLGTQPHHTLQAMDSPSARSADHSTGSSSAGRWRSCRRNSSKGSCLGASPLAAACGEGKRASRCGGSMRRVSRSKAISARREWENAGQLAVNLVEFRPRGDDSYSRNRVP